MLVRLYNMTKVPRLNIYLRNQTRDLRQNEIKSVCLWICVRVAVRESTLPCGKHMMNDRIVERLYEE